MFKTDYPFWVACGLLTILRFATVIPSAPGNLGVVNVATMEALKLFELPEVAAKTSSIILFGSLTLPLPLLIGGAFAPALTGVNIGEIRERTRRSADTSPWSIPRFDLRNAVANCGSAQESEEPAD